MTAGFHSIDRDSQWGPLCSDKELLLRQHAKVLWMCGLSGAGKTTLANRLDSMLLAQGFLSVVIDADAIRNGMNAGLGFSLDDRTENLRRVAEMARLLKQNGIIAIVACISPTHESRQNAKKIIGEADYLEAYIQASLSVCERRDTKGLYARARAGEISLVTGIDSPFEPPVHPDTFVNTETDTPEISAQLLFDFVLPHIQLNL